MNDDRSVDEGMNTLHPNEKETVIPSEPEVPPGWGCPPELRGRVCRIVVVQFANYSEPATTDESTIRPPRL